MHLNSSSIEFAGGGLATQAGVGGMDGAHSILKLADKANAVILSSMEIHMLSWKESSRLTSRKTNVTIGFCAIDEKKTLWPS